jgi:hypothetical protein
LSFLKCHSITKRALFAFSDSKTSSSISTHTWLRSGREACQRSRICSWSRTQVSRTLKSFYKQITSRVTFWVFRVVVIDSQQTLLLSSLAAYRALLTSLL